MCILLINMFANKNDPEYVDNNRPHRLLRNHDGTQFKICTSNKKSESVQKSLLQRYSIVGTTSECNTDITK